MIQKQKSEIFSLFFIVLNWIININEGHIKAVIFREPFP
ncbi:conserved hypothetical protein [Vibrio cholerae MO10]|uniref:Uncharacterized protein n=1 Tax=Vibrio cholerae (strain MO10) TaxID=345072 RepID=A0A0X1KYG7_VIBCO|nr:conserved hypothetical protein [Vibrio cholerae MO10]CSI68319.1 Uncharacterised protein [Vibrio cholerae]